MDDKFYVIATAECDEDTIDHEIGHGLYYLNDDYTKEMSKIVENMSKKMRGRAEKYLKESGYYKGVFKDELQAYFATGIDKGMISLWDHIIFQPYIQKIKKVFKKYRNEII